MGPETPSVEKHCCKSLTVWGWIIPWTWTRIEGAGAWRLYRILLRRTHVGRAVAILHVRETKERHWLPSESRVQQRAEYSDQGRNDWGGRLLFY